MNKDCLPVLAAPPFPIFDSHAHYDSEQFDADREPLLSNALPQKGVVGVINMGSDLPGCLATLDLCKRFDYVYGAVGIHPECAKNLPEDWLSQVEGWLGQEKIVAVGEIGLSRCADFAILSTGRTDLPVRKFGHGNTQELPKAWNLSLEGEYEEIQACQPTL